MIDYFDFSKNDGKVFIPKAKHTKKSCTFDKFHKSIIQSTGLDNYAKHCEKMDKKDSKDK